MQPKSICEDGGSLYCDGFVDARPAMGTCTAYCQIKGLKCTDAWDDDEPVVLLLDRTPCFSQLWTGFIPAHCFAIP